METKGLSEGIFLDRNEWKKLIHVPDPAEFSFVSCSLPQILGTNGLVVVVVYIHTDTFYVYNICPYWRSTCKYFDRVTDIVQVGMTSIYSLSSKYLTFLWFDIKYFSYLLFGIHLSCCICIVFKGIAPFLNMCDTIDI